MSMIGDIQAQQRKNPIQSADEFAQSQRKPDTMSGQFMPSFSPDQGALSSLERGALQTMQEVDLAGQRATEQESQITELKREQAARERYQAQQEESNPYGSVDGAGEAYKPDGSLSQSRQQLLSKTASYEGSPYKLGGRTAQGIDCSGLVMSVYNQLGFNIQSHSVSGQANSIPGVKTSVSNLRPGDLVVWGDNSHIAVYAGNGQIWDASRSKGTSLRPLWPNQVYGIAVRLPGE
jgi:cell wall-associated NlpC family hydrolase